MPAATGVAHGGTARHRPVVEWAVQSTNNPTGDLRGPTYGSEGWGFESLRARHIFEDVGSLARCVLAHTFLFAPSRRLSRLEIISS